MRKKTYFERGSDIYVENQEINRSYPDKMDFVVRV